MSNLFPRLTAAIRDWAKAQLVSGGVARAVKAAGKLAQRVHRDQRSTSTPAQRKPQSGRADAFADAIAAKAGKQYRDAADVVEALLRPRGKPLASAQHETEAAIQLLEQLGYTVVPGSKKPAGQVDKGPRARRGDEPRPCPRRPTARPEPVDSDEYFPEAGPDLGQYRVGGRRYQFNPDDPILTGEMIPVDSSNVHSIGYIWNDSEPMKGTLKVRFLGTNRSTRPQSRSGKGPIYHYYGVHPEVFMAFRVAASKGKFVWDRLRVRGTVAGHQFPYELAKLESSGYVPRAATRIGGEEHFIRRTVRGKNGKTYRSVLQDQFVRMVGENNPPPGVIAGRGAPNRGAPNRGTPNRGRPDRGGN